MPLKWNRMGAELDEFGRQLTYSKCRQFCIIRHGRWHYEVFRVEDELLVKSIGFCSTMIGSKDYANEAYEKETK